MKKYFAEFFGAFILSLVVGLSVSGTFPIVTPVLAGLTLGLFVYTIGALSGCHINPAVTIGLLSIGKIKMNEAAKYIVSQLIGGFLASVLLVQTSITLPPILAGGMTQVFAETLGTMLLAFGVASIVYGRVSDVASGLVIGGSLLLGISIAAMMGSAGILNPAVALGLSAYHPTYLALQILVAVLGFNLYKNLQK